MRRSAFPTKHIAVLPFHSAQSEAADQALADGLSEVITASLRRLEANDRDLLVVPSQDIQSQHVSDVRAARRAYSVKLVVLGDVAHENGQVRLAITVVDAARERPMASTTIQEREDRLALVHTRAVQEVSRMLGVRPSPANPSPVPPSVYAAWLRGRGFLDRFDKSANVASAITEFESALTAAPAYTPALVGLGQAYLNRFDTTKDPRWLDAALGSAAKAIEVDHDSAEAYTVRGGVHNARGEYKEAVEDFERALILNARLDDAYRGLARAFERMGLMQRAEATYEKAIAARPDYWAGYHWLAAFHYKYGRYQAAAGQFRRVVQLTPDNAQAYSNLGSALAKLGKLDEARRMYETAIRIAPSYGAYNNFANLLLRQRLFAEAAAAYEKALELNSQDHNVWGNLGAAYLRTPGQKSRANDAYRRAIQLAEKARSAGLGDPNLLARLAQYYAIQGKRSEPLELLRTALAQAPTDVSVLISAAITYETLGFREEALQWVRKSLELGYPRLEVEQTPDFDELRKDRRFLESIPSPK
jgi:tetratricopeptide (TPR) repeat protein/TolB-like protein